MDPDTSQCPEDNSTSTDCLLRAVFELLQNQLDIGGDIGGDTGCDTGCNTGCDIDCDKVDWDPINLAFTLLIGILALLFAGVAVIKAVLAPGKGKRRCSEDVIGAWSDLAKKKWDFSEMKFQFMAETPVLTFHTLGHPNTALACRRDFSKDDNPGSPASPDSSASWLKFDFLSKLLPGPTGRRNSSKTDQAASPDSSASWLKLMEKVGLVPYDVKKWPSKYLRATAANYLPDELVAVPAYAQVGVVVLATVMAGVTKLDVDEQNYPNLLAEDFQFHFHHHPGLGVVGVYSKYPTTPDSTPGSLKPTPDSLEPTPDSLEPTPDSLEPNPDSLEPTPDSLEPTKINGTNDYRYLRALRDYACGFLQARLHIASILLTNSSLLGKSLEAGYAVQSGFRQEDRFEDGYLKIQTNTATESHLPLLLGLFTLTPAVEPLIFPNRTIKDAVNYRQYITALALTSRFFSHAPFNESWIGLTEQFGRPRSLSEVASGANATLQRVRPKWVELTWRSWGTAEDEEPRETESAGDPPANVTPSTGEGIPTCNTELLMLCIWHLHNPDSFEVTVSNDPFGSGDFRKDILKEIKQLDEWLESHKPSSPTKVHSPDVYSILLFNTAMIVVHIEHLLHPKSLQDSEDHWDRRGTITASQIHSHTLPVLQKLVELWEKDVSRRFIELLEEFEQELHGAKKLAEFVFLEDPYQQLLMKRLSVLVKCHSKGNRRFAEQKTEGTEVHPTPSAITEAPHQIHYTRALD